ncbi:hypothetical protein [Larsenimonas salina]|uniref:hypothetical protein n=1 Tax=Larsenimonas salina TaxID=1295565 RepID=UPI002072E6A2|nr:hypothetical protein [Larsenimonas salina]MCM5703607.1 hypothetical protein [Larsenimonas salina]
MHEDSSFFGDVGEAIGAVLKSLIDFLSSIWQNFFGAIDDFIDGVTRSLGISPSVFSIALLVIGLMFLYGAVRAFMRGSILGGAFRLGIGVILLSWLTQ